MSEVEKHKSIMTLAMTASSMSALLVLLDRQDCIKDNLLELKAGIELERAKRMHVEMSEQRRSWLKHLSPVDAQRWQDSNIKLRQPGSGIWFTDGPDFQEWLSNRHSKLWVHGIPGAGKTILMASAIQEALKYTDENHALAFFYCDYKVTATHDPKNMLGSLAKQIAVQNERCFRTLQEFWGNPGSPGRFNSSGGVITIEAYLGIIEDLSAHFSDVMIIVDGLDEVAVNRSGAAHILQSLNLPHGNIKTLFASRKEIDLEHPLREFKQLSIAAMSSDLRLYVASEIERRTASRELRIQDPKLKEHIMRTLVEKADGMFRWVACQLDYLGECTSDRERREALNKLPPDIPSSYERILDRINKSRNKGNQRLVVCALQWILYAKCPLDTPQLLEALAIEDGDVVIDQSAITTEEDILHWASSLIRKRAGGGLEIAHFTVKEFLVAIDCQKTPQFSPYLMSEKEADIQLAKTCLTFLNCRPFSEFDPRDHHDLLKTVQIHPFLPYAAVQWDCHSIHHMEETSISRLAHQLFHPNITKQFNLYRLVRHVNNWYEVLKGEHPIEGVADIDVLKFADSTPLHWAAYLGLDDLCAWLISEGLSVHQMSRVGTPLNCALLGHYAIQMYREEDLDDNPKVYQDWDIAYEEAGDILDPRPEHRPRLEIVQLLLTCGVSPDARTSPILEMLPLSIAVRTCYPDRCSALIAAGARFSDDDLYLILDKLENGRVDAMAEYIIDQALENMEAVLPEAHETLFDLAVKFRSSLGNHEDESSIGAERLLRNLSSHPDALDWVCSSDITGRNLHFLYPLLKVMGRTILSPDRFPSRLRKIVLEAVRSHDTLTISSLLDKGANPLSALADEGSSVLHLAISGKEYWSIGHKTYFSRYQHWEMVKLLVESGCRVDEQNAEGETSLHLAAKQSDVELFQLLLKAVNKEDWLDIRTHTGLTANDCAVKAGSTAIVELISQHREQLRISGLTYSQDLPMEEL